MFSNGIEAGPKLDIQIHPEDLPNSGLMVLGLTVPENWPQGKPTQPGSDLHAQYKMVVTLNGVPVSPDSVSLAVCMKQKRQPFQPQFGQENLLTRLVDKSNDFIGKFRECSPGVGVLDLYYLGPIEAGYVAEYEVVIQAVKTTNGVSIFGTALANVCILGFAMGPNSQAIPKPNGDNHFVWADPLGLFVNCEAAVLEQRFFLGVPIETI